MQAEPKKIRTSSWELLRILAMLVIIFSHFVGQSGFFIWGQQPQVFAAQYISFGNRIAVNIFFILGAWFMVNSQITGKRILSFYSQVWTYTALGTLYVLLRGFEVDKRNIIAAFLPFISKAVWFASAYIVLLLLAPFLRKILDWERKRLQALLTLLFILNSILPTLLFALPMDDGWFAFTSWVCFIYLAVGYYKKYISEKLSINHWLVLAIGITTYLILVTCRLHFGLLAQQGSYYATLIAEFCSRSSQDYKTIPNLFIAASIFYFFEHIKIKTNKTINFLATGAFAAYIIHQTPAIIPVIWRFWFQCNQWIKKDNALIYSLLVPIAVYLTALLLEWLRRKLLEPIITSSKPFNYIASKLDHLLTTND